MQFHVGQRVIYHPDRENYRYEAQLFATVVKVGVRITIRIDGQEDMRPSAVLPERLTPA
jgi:hypothetical protein